MKLNSIIISLPVLFKFIIFISFVEIIFLKIFELIGLQEFQMIPYIRLVSLLFTFLFFFKNKFYNSRIFKVSLKKNSENTLVMLWVVLTIFGFFVGIVHGNTVLYLFTDMIYILFGYLLYRIFSINSKLLMELSTELSPKQERYFIGYMLISSIITFFININLPSFLVVFFLVYAFYHLKKGNYWFSILYTIPFFFQILKSNRALLIVFILILFFAFVKNSFSKKNVIDFLIVMFVFLLLCFLFLDDLLKIIISIFPQQSTLKDRLVQLYLLSKGNVDWNSSVLLSISQRIDEVKVVIEYWFSNPFTFLFGGGMGATVEGFAFKDVGVGESALLGKSSIHNIHILPFSLIFRYGVFGIALFLILINNLFKYLFLILFTENSLFKTMILFQFCWILYSLPAASYLWTCPLFWISIAYISNEKRTFTA